MASVLEVFDQVWTLTDRLARRAAPTATGRPRVADHGVNAIVVALVTGIAR
jgi:hypothetical protein